MESDAKIAAPESKRRLAEGFALPEMQGKSLVSLERGSAEGTRKRKAQMQLTEDIIIDFFKEVAESCQERKKLFQTCAEMESHAMLCSALMTHDIEPSQSIDTIYKKTAKLIDDSRVIRLFREQWENYVRYLFASNATEARQKAAINPKWFEQRKAKITFKNVFSNDLWEATNQDAAQFDLFATGSYAATKRPAEELLGPNEAFNRDAPTNAFNVIMDHVENRKMRARSKVLNKTYRNWLEKWAPSIRCLPDDLKFDKPKLIFEPLTARQGLRLLVQQRRENWAQAYAKQGDRISDYGPKWEKEAEMEYDLNKQRYEANQKKLQELMEAHAKRKAYHYWTTLILEAVRNCREKIERCCDHIDVLSFHYVRRNWPTPAQENQQLSKRFRLFGPAQPPKTAPTGAVQSANIEAQVRLILDNGFAGIESETDDELTTLKEVLIRLEDALKQHQALKTAPEPLEERKCQFQYAVFMDHARFVKQIAERVVNQARIVLQTNVEVEDTAIKAHEKFEADLVAATLESKDDVRRGYAEVYDAIHDCIAKKVWDKLAKRADLLRDYDEKQRGIVAVYEPWLDQTLLTKEQQKRLSAIVPDLQQVPQTLSAALIQSSSWFERLYQAECEA